MQGLIESVARQGGKVSAPISPWDNDFRWELERLPEAVIETKFVYLSIIGNFNLKQCSSNFEH